MEPLYLLFVTLYDTIDDVDDEDVDVHLFDDDVFDDYDSTYVDPLLIHYRHYYLYYLQLMLMLTLMLLPLLVL